MAHKHFGVIQRSWIHFPYGPKGHEPFFSGDRCLATALDKKLNLPGRYSFAVDPGGEPGL